MKTNHHTTKLQGVVKPLRDIGFLTIALTLALIANFTYAQFTSPTEAPTGGNIATPVNTSDVTQTKPGYFGVNTLFAANRVRSDFYCDRAGENCWEPAAGDSAGGSASQFSFFDHYETTGYPGLPNLPIGLTKWPDYIVCEGNIASEPGVYTLYLAGVNDQAGGRKVSYSSTASFNGYSFGEDGLLFNGNTVYNTGMKPDCGSGLGPSGANIVSMCDSGLCGYFDVNTGG